MSDHFKNVGLDVGSTTVKAVVLDDRDCVLWKDYRRHNARQPELVLEFLNEIESAFPGEDLRVFTTGNGGRSLAPHIDGYHVQEVNGVTCAVERIHPEAGSVVELGGQDAKVIVWKRGSEGGKSAISFMNDKCAGGTGATLDKIFAKMGLDPDRLGGITGRGKTVHHIAAKCGVFAETDVVGLMKAGVDEQEIVVSLCTAIVKQNIEVLLHGNVLPDDVLLLGGPHTYLPVFEEVWRRLVPEIWEIHRWVPKKRPVEELIYVPPDAQYFAAMGAVFFGRENVVRGEEDLRIYGGADRLEHYIAAGKELQLQSSGASKPGLVESEAEALEFISEYSIPSFSPKGRPSETIKGYLGIDGGSTSSKIAIIDTDGELIYKDYVLSRGNPIVDVREMFRRLTAWLNDTGTSFDLIGAGVTGYASSILREAFDLDLEIVETVAHMKSARSLYGDVDVICDVGGQDIKVLIIKHGRVVDIRLNTQCSAGNGYFLQSMAEQFGVPMEEYADRAFKVRRAPSFNYGCAVFMEQDKVNFQQLGWSKDEIMAGLALVLPLNIWNFVVQEANLRRLGTSFLLQGGTQKNLAAVKAQVDFIKSRVPGATVRCHKYADIAGAMGAAIEVRENAGDGRSSFVGLERAGQIEFKSINDESTVCKFCSNRCPRTFIDIRTSRDREVRHITGYGCEKGMSQDVTSMREREKEKLTLRDLNSNLVEASCDEVFAQYDFEKSPFAATSDRSHMVVGMPRLLNLYVYAPFFSTYFRSLGVGKVVYSDYTSEKLWSEGNKWGAIDPCFPAKVAPAHVYNLLLNDEVTHICFPIITHLESMVDDVLGNNACVIQMGTPEVVDAAFTKDRDHFVERGVEYWKPLVRMDRRAEAVGNLFDYFGDRLSLTEEENAYAAQQGFGAMEEYFSRMRSMGSEVLNTLVADDRIGILFIGHPYHHDIGLNHGILEEFRLRGFPILCIESIPTDREFLDPLFGGDVAAGTVRSAVDISDVWKRNFNRNTNVKIWAAKVAARHPNLAVIDISSFKCGHDAPTYSYVDAIMDASLTPHFLFHDLDQNKPSATIKIRIQSIDYFLRLEEELLRKRVDGIVRQLEEIA